ncbi:uncharacterized protein LOC121866481 isoform X1 [Homarus americanus]|uniref:uncharacterized protein LOC121866481 isoform X1 n=1 Tax=Homarus americanus TaxID=6706 RepID=UPI001C465A24|nr:uncharacterized protein LOC121866481 isoform X1 [Homarus americanus]
MCTGCSVNLFQLFEIVSDEKKVRDYLFDHHLLTKTVNCTSCGSVIELNSKYQFRCNKVVRLKHGKAYRKRVCKFRVTGLKDTFFERSKISLKDILYLMYLFIDNRTTIKTASFETKLSPATIIDWYSFMRDIIINYCETKSSKLGGPGTVVEVDEAEFGQRKCDKAEVRGNWVLGGIERGGKKIFLVTVGDRSEETLIEVIKDWILEGTTIVSDRQSSFRNISLEGYFHQTGDNPQNSKDSESSTNTNNIKRLWRDVRNEIPKFGVREEHFESYLAKVFFRKIFPDQGERFHHFMLATAALYPPYK